MRSKRTYYTKRQIQTLLAQWGANIAHLPTSHAIETRVPVPTACIPAGQLPTTAVLSYGPKTEAGTRLYGLEFESAPICRICKRECQEGFDAHDFCVGFQAHLENGGTLD